MDVLYVRDLRYERVKETRFCECSIARFWRIFLFFDSIVFKLLRCFSLYRIGSITLRKLIVFNLEATPFLPVNLCLDISFYRPFTNYHNFYNFCFDAKSKPLSMLPADLRIRERYRPLTSCI